MTDKLKQDILDFELQKITKDELLSRLPFSIENKSEELRRIINDVINSRIGSNVEYGLTLLWLLEDKNEYTDLLHSLIIEPWHSRYEDIIHSLQHRKDPTSVPIIKIAIQQKYDYLESYGTGTGQFISQCGHALKSIGTKEAIETIKDLADNSDDPIIKTEMKYRLNKIFSQDNVNKTEKVKRWWDF
jgi:HEAT repeat protein